MGQNLPKDMLAGKRAQELICLLLIISAIMMSIALFGKLLVIPQTKLSAIYTATPTLEHHPVLGDPRVRQGIAYCANRTELLHSVYPWLEYTTPFEMTSFLPIGHWAYPQNDHNLFQYPFDPEKGKALFDEAGWKLNNGAVYRTNTNGRGMRLVLTASNTEFQKTWVAVFEKQMKACGLHIVRNHVLGEWLYETGLSHRDFEMVSYSRVSQTGLNGLSFSECNRVPSQENEWRGDNYTGWCNPEADRVIRIASTNLSNESVQNAYRTIQEQYTHDISGLPLFNRVDVYAANPALQNFKPNPSEMLYTWNAAKWIIPGRDTIVIAQRSEPSSLFMLDNSFITQLIGGLLFGVDYTNLGYDYQPVMLKQIPSVENGAVKVNVMEIHEGEEIVDLDGNTVTLQKGIHIRDVQGNEITYGGETVKMNQFIVKYEFVDGLTWSDGISVTKDDYELSYRILCDPKTGAKAFLEIPSICNKIADVEFLSNIAYVVTWKPGYTGQAKVGYVERPYFLPPIGRQPSHQILSDGQKLADAPPSYWSWLNEVNRQPLGVGPYVVDHWEFGREIVFTANPYYYQGIPSTPKIILRFLPQEQAMKALLNGEVDLVDSDSLPVNQMDTLMKTKADGKINLYLISSIYYEVIDFSLTTK
jgi:ABC-type transport system substrate-binding protein